MVPALVRDYEALPSSSPLKAKLAEPVALLKAWDFKWGADSVANSVAIFWGEALYNRDIRPMRAAGIREDYVDYLTNKASANDRLQSLSDAVDQLTADFGTWKTPWGNINRYQRITDDIDAKFDDNAPSVPVPFDSAQWGSIASYGAVHDTTKKWYGVGGNSFIASVEFGPKVQAWSATVGGESGDPKSPHFKDQVDAYITRQIASGLLLSGRSQGAHRARLSSGRVMVCTRFGRRLNVFRRRPILTLDRLRGQMSPPYREYFARRQGGL